VTLTIDPDCENRDWEVDESSLPSEEIEVLNSFNFTISDRLEYDSDGISFSTLCPEFCNTNIRDCPEFVTHDSNSRVVSIAPFYITHVGDYTCTIV
jgi:hypothetical protein